MNMAKYRKFYSMIGRPTGLILSLILGALISWVLLTGVWAIILAIVDSTAISVVFRSARILAPSVKGILTWAVIGFLVNTVVVIWAGLTLALSANLWAGAVFTLTLGILRIAIPDENLAHWLSPLAQWSASMGLQTTDSQKS